MKAIIIGLGNFGSSLALRLMDDGHEVIGVDRLPERVGHFKDELTHTVVVDTTHEYGLEALPLADSDLIAITIGSDLGSSLATTALVKKYCGEVKVVVRASSSIQHTILEAMGISDIITPEITFANQLASRLSVEGALKAIELDGQFEILETEVPKGLVDMTVVEADLRGNWSVSIVTILKRRKQRSMLGGTSYHDEAVGVVTPETKFEAGDKLVLFGHTDHLKKMIDAYRD